MRILMIAAVVAAMALGGTAADAQRLGPQGKPMPMPHPMPMPPQGQPMPKPMPMPRAPGSWQGQPRPNPQPMPMPRPNPGGWHGGTWNGGGQWNGGGHGQWNGRSRWGGRIGGFWWAGVQAPGGWNGYYRIKRGKRLPTYWVSPNYVINDWQMYGLGAPPAGYYWTRYYNDAVLIDQSGMVYDSIGGVDWDRYQGGYAYDDDYAGVDGGAAYPPAGYPAPQGPPPVPGYGAPYPVPGYGDGSTETRTVVVRRDSGYADGVPPMAGPPPRIAYGETYYVTPGSVVTVTMPGAVTTTTTTTTEYIYERTVAKRKVWRKPVRKWRPRPKPRCICGS